MVDYEPFMSSQVASTQVSLESAPTQIGPNETFVVQRVDCVPESALVGEHSGLSRWDFIRTSMHDEYSGSIKKYYTPG